MKRTTDYTKQLARIHALKRDLDYTDQQYRTILQALYKRTSSAMLTDAERDDLIQTLTGFQRDRHYEVVTDEQALAILG